MTPTPTRAYRYSYIPWPRVPLYRKAVQNVPIEPSGRAAPPVSNGQGVHCVVDRVLFDWPGILTGSVAYTVIFCYLKRWGIESLINRSGQYILPLRKRALTPDVMTGNQEAHLSITAPGGKGFHTPKIAQYSTVLYCIKTCENKKSNTSTGRMLLPYAYHVDHHTKCTSVIVTPSDHQNWTREWRKCTKYQPLPGTA